jgi:DivIVA domain-containing protein
MPDQSSAATEHALMQEITAPLERLPDDPRALVEAEFPTAMRGYDRHAVDDYVEQVGNLVAELQATRSPEAAVRRALERVGEQISGVLQRAHQTAEQITAQSLADAEDLSGQLLAVARDAAERFPAEDKLRPPGDGELPEDELAPAAEDELAPAAEDELAPAAEDELAPAAEDLSEDEFVDEDDDPDEDEAPAGPAAGSRESTPEVRRVADEDSTQIIPPASDAAQHRDED